jgi:hypothetical protein
MSGLSECQRCQNNARSPYLLCAIHPNGSVGDCPDFKPQLHSKPVEFWEPDGASYCGDQLIVTSISRWTQAQRQELLAYHPAFTGLCPICHHQFEEDSSRIHWDCPICTWVDDSL